MGRYMRLVAKIGDIAVVSSKGALSQVRSVIRQRNNLIKRKYAQLTRHKSSDYSSTLQPHAHRCVTTVH
jgi:hypothetical protein